MLFFKDSSEVPIQVYFITEPHLKMLKAYAIPFSDLPTLLYYNLSHDDLLSWITWQRAVESKLFFRAMTTYHTSPPAVSEGTPVPVLQPDPDGVFQSALQTCYQQSRQTMIQYYEQVTDRLTLQGQPPCYAFNIADAYTDARGITHGETITLLAFAQSDTLPDGFHPAGSHPARALYAALLYKLGHHGLYFKNTTKIPYSAVQGITLKNLIPLVISHSASPSG